MLVPAYWGVNASAPPGGVLGGCSGHLFAFSGLDGNTSESTDFAGVWEHPGSTYDLRFCGLRTSRTLTFGLAEPVSVTVATNDVIQAGNVPESWMSIAWVNASLLVGTASLHVPMQLSDSTMSDVAEGPTGAACTVTNASSGYLAFCRAPTDDAVPWALVLSTTRGAAVAQAAAAASNSTILRDALSARLAPYAGLASVGPPEYAALAAKAFSVMRVNALSAEGGIKHRWSTPDRMPHRWMWLWDSCYHSLAANHMPNFTPTDGATLG